MTELERLLPLWRELEESGIDYVLATVAAVKGSSYRRPGARMLLSADGRRVGTISGGCLEAEVARRAFWLTAIGPALEDYSTATGEDGERPYGSGCGGVVSILLERRGTAAPLLAALEQAFQLRAPIAMATVLDGPRRGQRAFAALSAAAGDGEQLQEGPLAALAAEALKTRSGANATVRIDGEPVAVWVDFRPARPGLWIFGAGDDALPLVEMAKTLGWFVAVADGRSHLASRSRFPGCDAVQVLNPEASPAETRSGLDLRPTDAALLMTHSFAQDASLLAALLGDGALPVAYLGVLGPLQRTHQLLEEAACRLGLAATAERIEGWLRQIHAPVGLDLGCTTPAEIALAALAEMQQVFTGATALPLQSRPLREGR